MERNLSTIHQTKKIATGMNVNQSQETQCSWWRPFALSQKDYPSTKDYMKAMLASYFSKLYHYEGYNVVIEALDQWLEYCEELLGGREFINYGEPNDALTRWNCIVSVANSLRNETVEQSVSILDIPNNKDNVPIMEPTTIKTANNVEETNNIDASTYEEWQWMEIQDSIETAKHEIKSIYKEFHNWVQLEKEVKRHKQRLARMFSKEVTKWSHLNFDEPHTDRSSVEEYVTTKHAQLKQMLPNQRIYPTLMRHVKGNDSWGKLDQKSKTFGDELSLYGCSTTTVENSIVSATNLV
ncbi:hypothetical protein G6F21_012745 [Rhizopus arrhizus]|nr:hypothetical protein G6F21_012745 [Rhizopus arrhizus]